MIGFVYKNTIFHLYSLRSYSSLITHNIQITPAATMKTLINLIFLLLILLCVPVFLYFVYKKTDAWNGPDKFGPSSSSIQNEIQIKNLQIARLKKENAELKAREQSPLARPPRPFGQGTQYTNSNSQSRLSRPPRSVRKDYAPREHPEDLGSIDHLHE